jgi:hypothetical protein
MSASVIQNGYPVLHTYALVSQQSERDMRITTAYNNVNLYNIMLILVLLKKDLRYSVNARISMSVSIYFSNGLFNDAVNICLHSIEWYEY